LFAIEATNLAKVFPNYKATEGASTVVACIWIMLGCRKVTCYKANCQQLRGWKHLQAWGSEERKGKRALVEMGL